MRTLLSATLLLLTAAALAAEEPKASPLSRKEIEEGWLMLFDGESTFGWAAVDGAKWSVFNGMVYPQADAAGPLVTTTEFGDGELRLEYRVREDRKFQVLVGCDARGQAWPGSHVETLPNFGGLTTAVLTVRNGEVSNRFELSSFFGGIASATAKTGEGGPKPPPIRGHIALNGQGAYFKSIKFRPMGARPLFNGRDLSGWKEFKGDKYKSKFTVKDGEIGLKDGPGDLQTEEQWADFVLQLECKSNGNHLNSGVFFRALPGEYQQGYECQIRNEFKDEPTQEYTIEVYDPKTNELKEKVKQKFAAVDYGTGAIYRRQPARKGIAKDGEWFTLTVIAHGRHMATWVDGVQVTDWTDNRPLDKNARNGCRLEKGAISLQGHDPTTDLNFRNIRIAELPPPPTAKDMK